jgi:uncharacterized protein YxeA
MEQQTKSEIYFPSLEKGPSNKTLLIILGMVLVIILAVVIFTNLPAKKEESTEFIKKQVDSLAKANAELQVKHAALDSTSKIYQDALLDLDWKVHNIGRDKTIIREYYREKVKQPANYTPKQVDSFFKKRYNY